jgi:superfamily II DNA/RNA helicase
MTKKQLETYDTLLGQAPLWVRMKIKHGLPPSKKESKDLNAFMGGIRQVSNTTSPFHASDRTPEEPKIEMAFNELNKTLQSNPQAKGVVYSNYLNSGLEPYKKRLDKAGIPYKMFTGEISKKERDQAVRDYNAGKLRALLISGAGGEGLDLKGTRVLQVLEPHWNVERIRQVEGRAARYRSHAHLPPEHQNVKIQRFLSTRPAKGIMENIGLKNPGLGVDEYLAQMSENKERLNQQFKALLKPQQLDIERRIAEAKAKKQQSEKQTG